jgi:membrane protein required for colicin V production
VSATLSQIGWVDWAVLAVLLISVIVGLVRGLLYEVMSLLGWVVAYVAAQAFGARVAAQLPVGAPGSAVNLAAAFVLVFVGTLIAWGLLSWLVKKLVQASPLSPLDRLLGAVFGLLRGAFVALAVGTVISLTPLAKSALWQASYSAAGLQAVLAGVRPWLPHDMSRHLPV